MDAERYRGHASRVPMAARIIVVDHLRPVATAVARVLQRRGYRVTVATSLDEACDEPGPFECGVFATKVGPDDGVSLAGWLMAEGRLETAIFFDDSTDAEIHRRANTIGTFLRREEGVGALCEAVAQAVEWVAVANGSPTSSRRRDLESGRRKKKT